MGGERKATYPHSHCPLPYLEDIPSHRRISTMPPDHCEKAYQPKIPQGERL